MTQIIVQHVDEDGHVILNEEQQQQLAEVLAQGGVILQQQQQPASPGHVTLSVQHQQPIASPGAQHGEHVLLSVQQQQQQQQQQAASPRAEHVTAQLPLDVEQLSLPAEVTLQSGVRSWFLTRPPCVTQSVNRPSLLFPRLPVFHWSVPFPIGSPLFDFQRVTCLAVDPVGVLSCDEI